MKIDGEWNYDTGGKGFDRERRGRLFNTQEGWIRFYSK